VIEIGGGWKKEIHDGTMELYHNEIKKGGVQ
jgi:hypothetical protein